MGSELTMWWGGSDGIPPRGGDQEGSYPRGMVCPLLPLLERWLIFVASQATLNGNKPAKGARIDKELQQEDDDMVRKMEARKERKRSEGMLRVENRG